MKVIELHNKMYPCNSREALVTVDSYKDSVMVGYLKHPRLNGKLKFNCMSQMILLLNNLLDLDDCPNQPLPLISVESDNESLVKFRIQILFRENYTWQGRLIWHNENLEVVFRSTLELIQLLDEILNGMTEGHED